jgi:hypothetical protein
VHSKDTNSIPIGRYDFYESNKSGLNSIEVINIFYKLNSAVGN